MKIIWKVIIIAIIAGLALAVLGLSMGASRTVYLNKSGVHIDDGEVIRVTESNLDYFKSIIIDTDFSDVQFISADEYGIDVSGYDMECDWSLENGILKITHKYIKKLRLSLSYWSSERNYVKVYFPKDSVLETVTINCDSGDISIGSFQADSLHIRNLFGDVELHSITSDDLRIDIDSGKLKGADLNARSLFYNNKFGDGSFQTVSAERFAADSDSGDLELNGCEFEDIVIKSKFGKTAANGVISSGADIYSDSGDLILSGEFSGETVIRSKFGDVILTSSLKKDDYSYDINVTFGSIKFGDDRMGSDASIKSSIESQNSLKITVSSGDVEVNFAK